MVDMNTGGGGGGGTISADEGALLAGANQVADTRAQLTQEARRVRDEIEQIKNSWKGGSADAFTSMMMQWDDQVKRLMRTLDQLEEGIRGTEKGQAAAEEESTVKVNKLMGILQNGAG